MKSIPVRLADLVAQERTRATDAGRAAAEAEAAGDRELAAGYRTARYWHERTARLITTTVPEAIGASG